MAAKRLHSAVYVGLKTHLAVLIIGRSKVRVLPGPPFFTIEINLLRDFYAWIHGLLVGGSEVAIFRAHD